MPGFFSKRKGKEAAPPESGGDFYRRHRQLRDADRELKAPGADGGGGVVAVRTLEDEASELARLVGAHNKAVAVTASNTLRQPSPTQLQDGIRLDFQEAQRQVVALKGVRATLLRELEGWSLSFFPSLFRRYAPTHCVSRVGYAGAHARTHADTHANMHTDHKQSMPATFSIGKLSKHNLMPACPHLSTMNPLQRPK